MAQRLGLQAAATAAVCALSSQLAGAQTILFSQPSYDDGIAPHFSYTNQPRAFNPDNQWYVHADQGPPLIASGGYVPVVWTVQDKTGLQVPANRQDFQRGIAGPGSHSAAQVFGDAVGGYTISSDIPHSNSPSLSMMTSPLYRWSREATPFKSADSTIGVAFDLQVPTAVSVPGVTSAFAKLDLLFTDTTSGTRFSYSCGVFNDHAMPGSDNVGFDPVTKTVIVMAQVTPPATAHNGNSVGHYVTLLPGNSPYQTAPWRGWKHFAFTISGHQFAAGLDAAAAVARAHGHALSLDPARYTLAQVHANTEMRYTARSVTELGWSIRRLQLTSR